MRNTLVHKKGGTLIGQGESRIRRRAKIQKKRLGVGEVLWEKKEYK